jgi:uncharacterized membrane protein YvbJ
MPLISCPDCGRQVSDIAPACPNCGRPFNSSVTVALPPETSQQPPEVVANSGVMSGVKIGVGMFIVLPLILVLLGLLAFCGMATCGAAMR